MSLSHQPKVLALVPAETASGFDFANPFTKFMGKPLLERLLEQIQQSRYVDKIVVFSNDDAVLANVECFEGLESLFRPEALSRGAGMADTTLHVLSTLKERGYVPDAVCVCGFNTPFLRGRHIDEAVDTMTIFGVDTVLSVTEEHLVPLSSRKKRTHSLSSALLTGSCSWRKRRCSRKTGRFI